MEVFLSHSAENFDRGESSSVSLISAIVKIWIRGVGVYRFSVENFLYQSAKKFGMGESFSVSLVFGIEKVNYKEGGGGVSRLSVENFLSHSAKNFRRGESFSFSKFSGTEKFYASVGYVTTFDFLSKIFCLTVPKCFVVEPLCAVFQKISDIEKLHG